MKVRQEHAKVTSFDNQFLEHGDLVLEIILLAQQTCHTTIFVFNWTDWLAFRLHSRFSNDLARLDASVTLCYQSGKVHKNNELIQTT